MLEAVCNAFAKGFEECKRKIVTLFHLLDLHDIIPIEPKEDSGDVDSLARAIPVETASLELVDPV